MKDGRWLVIEENLLWGEPTDLWHEMWCAVRGAQAGYGLAKHGLKRFV